MARGGRRPGAGRRLVAAPKLSRDGRVAILIRVDAWIRSALEQRVQQRSRRSSITHEAEELLKSALKQREIDDSRSWRGQHLYALGRLVAYTADRVEAILDLQPLSGGPSWRDDPFAARALPAAIDVVLRELGPKDGKVEIPAEAKRYADQMARVRNLSPDEAAQYSTPEAFGAMVGMHVALDLRTHVKHPPADPDASDDDAVIDADVANWMPKVREQLGLNRRDGGRK